MDMKSCQKSSDGDDNLGLDKKVDLDKKEFDISWKLKNLEKPKKKCLS